MKRSVLFCPLAVCLIVACLAGSGLGPAAAAPPTKADAPQTHFEAMLFTAEFRGTCGPPVFPGFLGAALVRPSPRDSLVLTVRHNRESREINMSTAGATDTLVLRLGGNPPLVSREMVQYSVVGTSGQTSLPTARILADVGPGGELSYKSDKGQNVVLQVDVKSVCWDLDQAKAIEMAKAAHAPYALLAVLQSEDLTSEVNPSGQMGSQKSVAVRLDLTLVNTENGAIVNSCSEERRQMDLSVDGAIRAGARFLASKCFKSMNLGK